MTKQTHTLRKIVYVDMDNVLVDFPAGIEQLTEEDRRTYEDCYDECPGIFALMPPLPGAIEGFHALAEYYDTYAFNITLAQSLGLGSQA